MSAGPGSACLSTPDSGVSLLWSGASDSRALQDGTVVDVRVFREAAYHGIGAGAMLADEILDYAAQAVRSGGKQAAEAFIDPTSAPEPGHILVDKLNNAYRRWWITDRVAAVVVEARLRDWAQKHRVQRHHDLSWR